MIFRINYGAGILVYLNSTNEACHRVPISADHDDIFGALAFLSLKS